MVRNARMPQQLHTVLDSPQRAAPVQQVPLAEDFASETSTRTTGVWVCSRDMKVVEDDQPRATIESSPDGNKDILLKNLTKSETIAEWNDINSDSADTALTPDTFNSGNLRLDQGDVIAIEYNVDTAGTTGPGVVAIGLEVMLLD